MVWSSNELPLLFARGGCKSGFSTTFFVSVIVGAVFVNCSLHDRLVALVACILRTERHSTGGSTMGTL